jgi:hypothetical protein
MKRYIFFLCIAIVAVMSFIPLASFAGFFGHHPRYLHAMSDLRYARALLEQMDAPNVMADEQNAVRELDAAIHEIKEAAADDWKLVGEHPKVDTSKWDHRGRLHEALKVLARAHGDVSKEEDDADARDLQKRAIRHIDFSMNFVRQALSDKKWDEKHE